MFIKKEFKNLISFLRRPEETPLQNPTIADKLKLWTTALLLRIFAGAIFMTMPILINEVVVSLDYGEDYLSNDHFLFNVLMIAILVPIVEEFIFRFPLKYKRNYLFRLIDTGTNRKAEKIWYKHFPLFFYAFATVFGLIHSSNYNNTSLLFYLLIPIIISSQIFGGVMYGYVRIKLGFWWGVLLHATFNLLLTVLPLFGGNEQVKIDIQNEGKIEQLQMSELVYRFGKEKDDSKINYVKIAATNDSSYYIDTLRFHRIDYENISLRKLIDKIGNTPLSKQDEDSSIVNIGFKYKYSLKQKDVMVNLLLTTKEPVMVEELMEKIGEKYSIERVLAVDTAQVKTETTESIAESLE